MQIGIQVLGLSVLLGGYRTILPVLRQEPAKKITEAEIQSAINRNGECEGLDQIRIDHLEYHDFFRDGQQEAVVVASTCATGTAGPDVHAVYRRDVDGRVAELPFRDPGELPRAGKSSGVR